MSIRTISQSINLQKQPDSDLNKYITEIGSNGITVHPEGQGNTNYLQIDSDMEIVRNGISVAEYGDNVRIGKEDSTKVIIADGSISPYTQAGIYIADKIDNTNTILASFAANGIQIGQESTSKAFLDYHSLRMKDIEGETYANISDLRDENGDLTLTQYFKGDGSTWKFGLVLEARWNDEADKPDITVMVNGVEQDFDVAWYCLEYNDNICFTEGYIPSADSNITITYTVVSYDARNAKAYTFGISNDNYAAGPYSIRDGYNTAATNYCSSASGEGTIANGYIQKVIGCYNVIDYEQWTGGRVWSGSVKPIGKYAFIIGNGKSGNSRSNALTVDWKGNVNIPSNATYQINGNDITAVAETVSFTACGKLWVFRRIGKIVFLDAPSDSTGVVAGLNNIGTLPTSMRPKYIQRIAPGNYTDFVFLNIGDDGVVQLYSNTAASGARNCSISTSYIVGD